MKNYITIEANIFQVALLNSKLLPSSVRLILEEETNARVMSKNKRNQKKKQYLLSTKSAKSRPADPNYKAHSKGSAGKIISSRKQIEKEESDEDDYLVESSESNKDSEAETQKKKQQKKTHKACNG